MPTFLQLIVRSLTFHRRMHAAVALGVAAATAVLTGALLVGDSVRGSLRELVLDRLGKIDDLIATDRFFRAALVDDIRSEETFARQYDAAVGVGLLPGGTLERPAGDDTRRASGVLVIGGGADFWDLGSNGVRPRHLPGPGQIVLNQPLADELAAKVGDKLVLRLPGAHQVPADSPLGKKTDRIQSLADLEVVDVIPAAGLGRFGLQSTQHLPRNAYIALEALQDALDQPERINAVLLAAKDASQTRDTSSLVRPRLADLGLNVQHVRKTFARPTEPEAGGAKAASAGVGAEDVVLDYYQVSSDRLLLNADATEEVLKAWADWSPQPALTYLANLIERADSAGNVTAPRIPYSTITAIDSIAGLGPLLDDAGKPLGPLGENEIVLTSWAASDLNAQVGDRIRVTWFEPETTHGKPTEQSAEFTLRAIVPLTEPREGYRRRSPPVYDERPTLVNDPDLTPTVEGVTDQESINDWDPPFPFDQKRVRPQDDEYWSKHRTTPKAYVSLATGRKLWASRFGATTAVRVAARDGLSIESAERRLVEQFARDGQRLGLDVRFIKQQALAAARGTTPFDALFLSLSFFVIIAALLLVALLFRLGLEQRATEIGVLLALGWNTRRVARLFAYEGAVVSLVGGAAGMLLGIGYAWLMLVGLRTWWLGAIATPFLTLHVTPLSLSLGFASGVAVAVFVNGLGLRGLRKAPVRPLLSGRLGGESYTRNSRRRGLTGAAGRWLVAGCGLCAAWGLAAGTRLAGQAQAGAFVAAGMALLAAILLGIWRTLAAGPSGDALLAASRLSLSRLAARNAGRNALRSTLTIGLVAAACFLIVAMSAFRLSPTESGAGGYALVAQSSQPIFDDLNDADTRDELWAGEAQQLDGTRIDSLRLLPGDDASCSNLYQATQPRVLGVPPSLVDHFDGADATPFSFAGNAATNDAERTNPWRLLTGGGVDEPIPVILDQNTALYSLHLYGGIGQEFDIAYPSGPVKFRVVGLLSNSVLQGSLLISESRFVRTFPEVSGYQYFLVRTPQDRVDSVARLLETRLSDQGFDATNAAKMLADFLAVQNTYLSTFQSLGALGLLLGTFGLATVQLRNVLERRSELALLRAAGFARSRLASLVLLEHVLLLVGGMATGVLAAIVAVLPFVQFSGSSAPLAELTVMLAIILVVGLLSGVAAVRATLQAPLIAALRGD